MAVARRGLTLEEFLQLPEEEPALEYIGGQVRRKVSPKMRHGALQSELTERINSFARPRRLARAFPEVRVTFAGESHVPDIVVFRWERIPADVRGLLADEVLIPPDIAIEILSPGQSLKGLRNRCLWYAANGVDIALLVDPVHESVLLFLPDGSMDELRGADRIDIRGVVPDFDLTVEALFRALRAH